MAAVRQTLHGTLTNNNPNGLIQGLRDAFTNKNVPHAPWTSGVIPLSESESKLFYERQDGSTSLLKLRSPSASQADDLSRACSPATFGLNQQDVFDESYRKAGKLDPEKFAWLFNPSNSGSFMSDLAAGLFPWNSLNKGLETISHSLYLGEGSFFKAHQDTPRSENMFGSLVTMLPIPHEGGNLLLRHGGREYTFDGQALLRNYPASLAYVAFFGDVEHEVERVISGHRATITYNLYFDSSISPPIHRDPITVEHPFKIALKNLLQDEAARSTHPFLGFGLEHSYPFKRAVLDPGSIQLKGSDVTLIQTLTELNIVHHFFLLYREYEKKDICPFRVLSNQVLDGTEESDLHILDTFKAITDGGFLVWHRDPKEVPLLWSDWYLTYRQEDKRGKPLKSLDLEWVTEPKEESVDRSVMMHYGNEYSLDYFYHQLCLVAFLRPEEIQIPPKANISEGIEQDFDSMDED
ncbi:hypothetical protein AN958_03553 [Leucoagaricus sp. SymC.cos]|nr:hypothetical protein AN958_03553 [Leucoagaricus sp. SymC.cos]